MVDPLKLFWVITNSTYLGTFIAPLVRCAKRASGGERGKRDMITRLFVYAGGVVSSAALVGNLRLLERDPTVIVVRYLVKDSERCALVPFSPLCDSRDRNNGLPTALSPMCRVYNRNFASPQYWHWYCV